ncbi:MAG: trypsin-like peptidase domain-containing protein [Clostridia bacterium]|nr:trypsin-like peptidase domain-containing protein [Clostridia bacterium]
MTDFEREYEVDSIPEETEVQEDGVQDIEIPVQVVSESEVIAGEEVDYKAEIQRLKAAYKAQRQEEKRKKIEEEPESKSGIGMVFLSVVLSVVVTFVLLAFLVGLLTMYPSAKQSVMSRFINKYMTVVQNPYPTQNDVTVGGETVKPSDNVNIQVNGEISATAIYAKASKSVVGIAVYQMSSGTPWSQTAEAIVSQGAGVIYSEDGLILTNHHVVQKALGSTRNTISSNYKIVVYFNTDLTEYYTVTEIVGYDTENDLALIRVNAKGLTPIEFGDVDSLEIGQPVVAIGSPGGIQFMNSISEGIISGLDRAITFEDGTVYELIQVTAAINPGNSGGALLNAKGELIGICESKIVSASYENMGFAVHVDTITRLVESFEKYGKYVKPMLGVEVNTLYTPEEAGKQNWPTGAYIADVTDGSCAEKFGIKAKDIICEVGGEKIVKYAHLRKFLRRYNPGDTVVIKIFRTSTQEYMDITVVLDASE